jgi:hypothetical protein
MPFDDRCGSMDGIVSRFRNNVVVPLVKNKEVRKAIRIQFRSLDVSGKGRPPVQPPAGAERDELEPNLNWSVRRGEAMGEQKWNEHWVKGERQI